MVSRIKLFFTDVNGFLADVANRAQVNRRLCWIVFVELILKLQVAPNPRLDRNLSS